MNHQPTPWKVIAEEPFCPELVDANNKGVSGIKLWEDDAGTSYNDLNNEIQANTRHMVSCVNANSSALDEIERLKYAISRIGFFCSGTEFHNIAEITLRVLAGESMRDICATPKQAG